MPGPIINDHEARIASILNGTAAQFEISSGGAVDSHWHEWVAIKEAGISAINRYDSYIQSAAATTGVSADWIRAIMYVENSHQNFRFCIFTGNLAHYVASFFFRKNIHYKCSTYGCVPCLQQSKQV